MAGVAVAVAGHIYLNIVAWAVRARGYLPASRPTHCSKATTAQPLRDYSCVSELERLLSVQAERPQRRAGSVPHGARVRACAPCVCVCTRVCARVRVYAGAEDGCACVCARRGTARLLPRQRRQTHKHTAKTDTAFAASWPAGACAQPSAESAQHVVPMARRRLHCFEFFVCNLNGIDTWQLQLNVGQYGSAVCGKQAARFSSARLRTLRSNSSTRRCVPPGAPRYVCEHHLWAQRLAAA